MLPAGFATPLDGGHRVVISSWRDVHEGAIAALFEIPEVCRVDVRPVADLFRVRVVAYDGCVVEPLPERAVRSIGLGTEGWDGPEVSVAVQHRRCLLRSPERAIQLSVVMSVCRVIGEGFARISAQAILSDMPAGAEAL
jgi:hypothetical protein